MARILILDGHPNSDSFCSAIADRSLLSARRAGADVRLLRIRDLTFDPILHHGYRKAMQWEQDLELAWEALQWSKHQVWIHPTWWGGMPASMKGFIDRLFLPGKAFASKPNSIRIDGLLHGRSARIITTLDQPRWWYHLTVRAPGIHQLRDATLRFSGVRPVRVTALGIIRTSTAEQRERWLETVDRTITRDVERVL